MFLMSIPRPVLWGGFFPFFFGRLYSVYERRSKFPNIILTDEKR